MVRLKPEYRDPDARIFNGQRFRVIKVRRHRIHPSKLAGAVTLWQVIVEGLMERYPWVVIENVWDWLMYRIQLWRQPRFAVPLTTTGRTIRVAYRAPQKPEWVVLSAKKAQR